MPSSEMTFSSYPGILSSTDDWYVTNNNLLITETTLEVINIEKYKNVKSAENYIPNFLRVLSASRFSKTGQEWCESISAYNSGTYSSQWMVIDYNKFKKMKGKKNKKKGLVYMLEQTPGEVIYHDITDHITSTSYFGSFNRAFLKETKLSLDENLIKNLYGNTFNYFGAQRRIIANHYSPYVKDLKTLKDLLRQNGYLKANNWNDPSFHKPSKAFSARLDFLGIPNGGIDTKVINSELMDKKTSIAISGPTTENNPNLIPFKFYGDHHRRNGVPKEFNFPYIIMNSKTLKDNSINDKYEF